MRNDNHSPTNMDPEAYEYVYAFDNQQPGRLIGVDMDWWRSITDWAPETAQRGTNQCHHCGAHIRYVAIMKHLPTGKYIAIGEQCLDNRFELRSKAEFDKLRKAAQLDRQKMRIVKAATEFINTKADGAAKTALDRECDLAVTFKLDGFGLNTVTDIRVKLWRYGDISAKQVAFINRLIAEVPERLTRQAERDAEVKVNAPSGKAEIEGVVVKVDVRENDWGIVTKLTIKATTAEGVWLGWVTEPAALANDGGVETGDTVALTATWEPSSDNPSFAFGKRPSKARFLSRAS